MHTIHLTHKRTPPLAFLSVANTVPSSFSCEHRPLIFHFLFNQLNTILSLMLFP
eukprot:CCRYP_004099-RA/>CCRYP_004099-RA protein AED:0.43 eAED:0.43 QI:34/1/1/1/0/0/2/79/53